MVIKNTWAAISRQCLELCEFFRHRNHGYTHTFRSKIIASTRRMKIRTLATPPESNTIQVEKKKTIPLDGATMVKETGRTIFLPLNYQRLSMEAGWRTFLLRVAWDSPSVEVLRTSQSKCFTKIIPSWKAEVGLHTSWKRKRITSAIKIWHVRLCVRTSWFLPLGWQNRCIAYGIALVCCWIGYCRCISLVRIMG